MTDATISATLRGDTFSGTFTEVKHQNTLGLRNDEQLRLFHLAVQNNRFNYLGLMKFLKRNVGRYVFSRAEIEDYKRNDAVEDIALDAVNRMRSQQDGMGLGEIMLYVLLEQILKAPKVLSKIEISRAQGQAHSRCDAIHLLQPDGKRLATSIVLGTSSVIGNMNDAIDAAFERVVDIDRNQQVEVQLAEQTVFTKTLDSQTAQQVKDLLVPQPGGVPEFNMAFSIFLCYNHGLNPKKYSNDQYRAQLANKMKIDIAAHAQYIADKINQLNLDSYAFYIYLLPLDNVDTDVTAIMDGMTNGTGGSHV